MAEETTILTLYIKDGDTYIAQGKQTDDNWEMTNPAKITFSYTNPTTTSAKLNWLLTPVFAKVLLENGTGTVKVKYNKSDITEIDIDGEIGSSIKNAYTSLTA